MSVKVFVMQTNVVKYSIIGFFVIDVLMYIYHFTVVFDQVRAHFNNITC